MKRPNLPARHSDNNKRRLLVNPGQSRIANLEQNITYEGSPKHKEHPHLYGLPPFQGYRGDTTLCDRDAGFRPRNMKSVHAMIQRGLQAGLVGENDVIWAVADNGWIFEGRITNRAKNQYHGYPVRDTEPIAEIVYNRFSQWVQNHGDPTAILAAENCKSLYKFK